MLIAFLFLLLSSLKGGEATRPCESNVCLNGGTCEVDDEEPSFQCICPPSFTGILCESEIPCDPPCRNGGACRTNFAGQQHCKCPKDYSGALCEIGSLDCTVQGCAPNERCVRVDGGSAVCVEDVCFPNPCENNGTCTDNDVGFICACSSGYDGRLCSHDIDECAVSPCEHGAECLNTRGSFECICGKGYRGTLCELPYFCDLNPCVNGGTCREEDNGYRCICPPGFSSTNCQEKQEEVCNCTNSAQVCINGKCVCPPGFTGEDCSRPESDMCSDEVRCLNGGTCDASNHSCICADGYIGVHCDREIECTVQGEHCSHGKCKFAAGGNVCECEIGFKGLLCNESNSTVDPCQNQNCHSGSCDSRSGIAVCVCPEGTAGEFCEGQDACAANPCLNGGHCSSLGTNKSDFMCVCEPGFSGVKCEVEESHQECNGTCSADEKCELVDEEHKCVKMVSSCNECENSIRCVEEKNGRARCICYPMWVGDRCDRMFEGCISKECESFETCRAIPSELGTTAQCGCFPGYAGPGCSRDTTVSFKAASFFLHQSSALIIGSSLAPYSLKFSFRTTLRNTHIVTAENILNQVQFVVELRKGYLYVNFSGVALFHILPFEVNDGKWYTVRIKNFNRRVSLSTFMEDSLVKTAIIDENRDMAIFWTRFGKDRDLNYRGCLRGVKINGETLDLVNSRRSISIKEGCDHKNQCSTNPCGNEGTCVDQWDSFVCDCERPFLPPVCAQKVSEVTLGHGNVTSRIEFSTAQDAELVKLNTDISLLIRTNKPDGAILYIGDKEEGGGHEGTFISLAIVNGSVQAKSSLGTKRVFSGVCDHAVIDNAVHLLRLLRRANNITMSIDGEQCVNFEVENRFDHPLLADLLVIGSADALRQDAFGTDHWYKGTMQDLRINERLVELSPLPPDVSVEQFGTRLSEQNVIEGTVSDDVCDEGNKCDNGKCANTFNDFECHCDYSWMGRTCSEKDHCALEACPVGVQCTNFLSGYICSSPATFVESSSALYSLEGASNTLTSNENVTFSIRTRSKTGQIVDLELDGNSLSVSLVEGAPIVKLTQQGDLTTKIVLPSQMDDGQWHTIVLGNQTVVLDGVVQRGAGLPLNLNAFLSNDNATLILGRSNKVSSFDGCLKDVQIGSSAPLSFFEDSDSRGFVNGSLNFSQLRRINLRDDCNSEDVCGPSNPCKNTATCLDLWNVRKCDCPNGFGGDFCEENINECKRNQCLNGECIDGIGEYRCQCPPGFSGQHCEHMVDYCSPSPCMNGGSCIARNSNSAAVCTCATGFFGSTCQQSVTATCSNAPCENNAKCIDMEESFSCECVDGYKGALCDIKADHCVGNPCRNGGQCASTATGYECLCAFGYTGRTCDQLEDKCERAPCVHGKCKAVWNDYLCECDQGWKGPQCDVDIDECLRFPCDHGANCTNTRGSFNCSCAKYYLGDRCEVAGSCTSIPCGGRGDCIQVTPTEHSCSCTPGYTGSLCEHQIDYCLSGPCLNGATCQRQVGGFKCECAAGYTGETCETDIDDCVDACMNGGSCTDKVNGFDCDCTTAGYEGTRCEKDIDECAASICANGKCHNLPGTFRCECPIGFIGRRCHVDDPCVTDHQNRTRHACMHGECVHPVVIAQQGKDVSKHDCDCETGYTGTHCDRIIQKPRQIPLTYVAGPVGVVLIALLLLGCALFAIVTLRSRRAVQGTYSPSHQEHSGSRAKVNTVLKVPPEERLI